MFNRWIKRFQNAFSRGVFPHELAFLIDNPARRLLLSPARLADRLPLTDFSCVLEVGAGSGFYSAEVARRISRGHLVLLDLQTEMLVKAKPKLAADGLNNVGYIVADAGALPFKENTFDVIYLVTVFGEITNQQFFLTEARRVLKSGGTLSVSEHYPDPDFSSFYKIKLLLEEKDFEFSTRYGVAWNYTANFSKI